MLLYEMAEFSFISTLLSHFNIEKYAQQLLCYYDLCFVT